MELGDLSSLTGNLDSQLSYLESLSRVVRAVAASSHSLDMSEGGLILPKMITKKENSIEKINGNPNLIIVANTTLDAFGDVEVVIDTIPPTITPPTGAVALVTEKKVATIASSLPIVFFK